MHRRIVQEFWRAPRLADRPGLKAVDLFRAVEEGQVKALWVLGTNPADSAPQADRVREAIRACPFVVVSDVEAATDTVALADVSLPALAWGEKSGAVTNSERCVSRQRAFLPAPGEAMADWRQICEVAKRMGFAEAFAYQAPHEIFAEHAALTALGNDGARDLDIGAYADVCAADYATLAPFSWPAPARGTMPRRFFADGRFYHPDRRARFVATPYRGPAEQPCSQFPLRLNTGRIRDQWHTMTRTAKAPRLMAQTGEPFLEIHPSDAAELEISAADLVEAESVRGRAVLRAVVTNRVRRGEVFAPMHWNDQNASRARVDALVAGATDPVSGQPELKATPVRLRRFAAAWHAFAISTHRLATEGADYFALARTRGGWRAELAGLTVQNDWEAYARHVLALPDGVEWLSYNDRARRRRRFAAFAGGSFVGALFAAHEPADCARSVVADQLGAKVAADARLRLLAGRPGSAERDRGPMVCACFDVGRNEILEALKSGCGSVAEIGGRLRAGTNCGACRGEIAGLLGKPEAIPRLAASERT